MQLISLIRSSITQQRSQTGHRYPLSQHWLVTEWSRFNSWRCGVNWHFCMTLLYLESIIKWAILHTYKMHIDSVIALYSMKRMPKIGMICQGQFKLVALFFLERRLILRQSKVNDVRLVPGRCKISLKICRSHGNTASITRYGVIEHRCSSSKVHHRLVKDQLDFMIFVRQECQRCHCTLLQPWLAHQHAEQTLRESTSSQSREAKSVPRASINTSSAASRGFFIFLYFYWWSSQKDITETSWQ